MNQIQVELQESMGSDKSIADSAWTSSLDYQKKKKRTNKDVERVVKMLAENKHATPFESVVFRFWIKLPITADRQLMTHRIASHSGMSGRYRTMPNEYLDIPKDVSEIIDKLQADFNTGRNGMELFGKYLNLCEDANNFYQDYIQYLKKEEELGHINNKEFKRLREFFRGVLPQNNMTERVTIMNLRSFANFQKLRNSDHAQPEIRQVAELMLQAVKDSNICPIAIKELEKYGWQI